LIHLRSRPLHRTVYIRLSAERDEGTEHKPFAEKECTIMLVEPAGTINTGSAGGEMTAENDIWI
jgi:hypothetical protein